VTLLPEETRLAALRALLKNPFKGKATPAAVKRHQSKQTEIMFALYRIDRDWPEDIKWYQLAMSLAAELYPACRMPTKPRGTRTEAGRERQRDLFRDFGAYLDGSKLTLSAAAKRFFKGEHIKEPLRKAHRKKMGRAGFSKSDRSFAQAARRFLNRYPQGEPAKKR
jgi:hypothetical protein